MFAQLGPSNFTQRGSDSDRAAQTLDRQFHQNNEKTGRLISLAAAIMVAAFGSFLIGHELQLKEFGFGMAASVALDAALIRAVLVLSIMEIMGNWNWWVPGFAERGIPLGEGEAETQPVHQPVGVAL